MTDEASIAPAAPSAAVIDAPTPNTPELGSQTPVAEKAPAPAEKPDAKSDVPKNAGEAIRRANEAFKAKEAERAKAEAAAKPEAKDAPKPEAKTEAKADPKSAERSRAEDGKFTPKESAGDKPADAQRAVQAQTEGNQTSEGRKPHQEAPARFLEHGKRDWSQTPETVQQEVHRMQRELEDGHKKYKESADRYEKVREFEERAVKGGTDLPTALRMYVGMEDALRASPVNGLAQIMSNLAIKTSDGRTLTLQDVAAHVMGQHPNEQVREKEVKIQELEAKIQQMELAAKAPDIVAEFAASHDRFEELSEVIATLLKTGTAKDLESAYELASVLKAPASNAAQPSSQPLIPAESAPAQTQAPALNPAGSKSVSGAPTGGISPSATRPVPKSNREALERAMARAGT